MPGDEHEVMLIPKPQNIRNGRNAASVVSQTAAAPQLFVGCLLVPRGARELFWEGVLLTRAPLQCPLVETGSQTEPWWSHPLVWRGKECK